MFAAVIVMAPPARASSRTARSPPRRSPTARSHLPRHPRRCHQRLWQHGSGRRRKARLSDGMERHDSQRPVIGPSGMGLHGSVAHSWRLVAHWRCRAVCPKVSAIAADLRPDSQRARRASETRLVAVRRLRGGRVRQGRTDLRHDPRLSADVDVPGPAEHGLTTVNGVVSRGVAGGRSGRGHRGRSLPIVRLASRRASIPRR
jgi:hypothetical protein